MARKREQRLRRKARAAIRAIEARLADERPITIAAIRYVNEIYAPNIKEAFSISNRRMDLVERVRAYQARHAARRAA